MREARDVRFIAVSRVPEGPASPHCCVARMPFALMQQCPMVTHQVELPSRGARCDRTANRKDMIRLLHYSACTETAGHHRYRRASGNWTRSAPSEAASGTFLASSILSGVCAGQ